MRSPLSVLLVNPPEVALEETYDATVSASTEITLNSGTNYIEVAAIAKPIFLKWGTADASSTDWDHVIAQETVRGFYVPAGVTAVNFIEQAASANLAVSEFKI